MSILGDWQRVRVSGHSMTPTLRDGDTVLVRHGAEVRPGDLVLARFRHGLDQPVLKRAVNPEDGGWVLASDNARAGTDSREYGPADVHARVCWIWHRGLSGSRMSTRNGLLSALRRVRGQRPDRHLPFDL
jgi:phage repressor protein C with HTH and peptisase S24 domain